MSAFRYWWNLFKPAETQKSWVSEDLELEPEDLISMGQCLPEDSKAVTLEVSAAATAQF